MHALLLALSGAFSRLCRTWRLLLTGADPKPKAKPRPTKTYAVSEQYVRGQIDWADKSEIEKLEIKHHYEVSCWLCSGPGIYEEWPLRGMRRQWKTVCGRSHYQHGPYPRFIGESVAMDVAHDLTDDVLKQKRLDQEHGHTIKTSWNEAV